MLVFGFGITIESVIVAYAACWPVMVATLAATRNIDPRLLEVGQALEIGPLRQLTTIIIPAVFGRVVVGLRTALGFALVVAVTVEILVNPRGLGYALILAQQSFRPDLMYAYIVWLAILGAISGSLSGRLDRYAVEQDRSVTYSIPVRVLSMLAFTAMVIFCWHLVATSGAVRSSLLPEPQRVMEVLFHRLADGSLLESMCYTVLRMLTGWLLASIAGIAIGAILGSSATFHRLFMPTLEAFRPLPASAVIPVAIIAFGLNETMSIAVIVFGSLWPVLLTSVHGFRNVPIRLREVATALELSKTKAFTAVYLPSAFVDIFPGLRTGLALALILTVVTEMQASLPGVGYDIFMAQRTYRSADLYAALIAIGFIGILVNWAILFCERRLMPWAAR